MANYNRFKDKKEVFKAVKNTKDQSVVIKTRWGEAVIEPNHYIVTDSEGYQFGMTPVDFEAQFSKTTQKYTKKK